MQVNLSFDTEKESLGNLKELVDALQKLINHREGKTSSPASVQPQKPAQDKTAGGCRVIPYEDMSGKMSDIFSGRRSF